MDEEGKPLGPVAGNQGTTADVTCRAGREAATAKYGNGRDGARATKVKSEMAFVFDLTGWELCP